jgi:AcrR family transcriptional regulator
VPTDPDARRRGRPPQLSIEERRDAILDAAAELYADGGRSDVSVEAIAALAGTQKPSVYRLYPSKAELYEAAVGREVERFTTLLDERYRSTAPLPLRERIDARATSLIDDVIARPTGPRFLIRAFHTWPDEDLERGRALRDSILTTIERHTVTEAAAVGVDLGVGAKLIALTTFTLTETVVELLVEEAIDRDHLIRFLADAMHACVLAAVGMASSPG